MTLLIRPTDTISGLPITKVRAFFRHLASWHQHSFDLPGLQRQFALDKESAQVLASALKNQGYIEASGKGAYKFSVKGEALVRACAAGSISRKTAERALAGLLERAEQYNSDKNKILTIEAIVIFGSFLSSKEKLGDLDIAVKCRDRKLNDDRAATALAYAERSGRRFSNFVECICWPNTEVCQILKARKRTIVIQDWQTFLRLATADSNNFRYKVVFGNPENIAAEVRARLDGKT